VLSLKAGERQNVEAARAVEDPAAQAHVVLELGRLPPVVAVVVVRRRSSLLKRGMPSAVNRPNWSGLSCTGWPQVLSGVGCRVVPGGNRAGVVRPRMRQLGTRN